MAIECRLAGLNVWDKDIKRRRTKKGTEYLVMIYHVLKY